jgi:CHAT domain-containing protein
MLKYVIRYYEKTRSKNSYQYAVAVNNQAMLYVQLGRIPEAGILLTEILSNSALNFPGLSLDPARIMTNKALIEIENKNYDAASDLLTRALKVYEEKELTDHSDYHQIRLQLAQLYLVQGKLTFFKEFIDKTLEEIGKDTGMDNLPYSYALEIKAEYLLETKEYQQSFELFQRIATIRAAKLGVLHKDYLRAISRQAVCQWKLGLAQKAFENFKNTTNSYLEVVDKFFYNMSEKEKARFWQTLKPELDIFYSFMLDMYKSNPELLPLAYNLRLKTKGLLLHNTNQVRDVIYSQTGDSLITKYEDWLSVKQILSGYYSMDKEMIEIMEADVVGLEAESNELEKELNRLVAGGLQRVEKERVTYQDVTEALQKDQVAVEIMRVSSAYGVAFTTDQYVAFVLKKGAQPSLVVIGDAKELESKMSVYYKNTVANRIAESLTHQKFWAPLQGAIGDAKQVIISPDGVYNLINLNSLKDEHDHYLIDLLTIDIVSNTKLMARKPVTKINNSEFVLIGNPIFGSPSITSLPGTAKELAEIKELLDQADTKVFSEELATEESLKKIDKPKVLHIATHGFFLGEVENSNTSTVTRSLRLSNPLLRSGLLLTGAGKIPSKELNEGTSDGVFTAYDAMNLTLQNTDLVVLSACETGTGEVVNGEGVYGLSRAFTIAGAQNLIMSLWKVDDQATMELMKLFYKDWLNTADIKSSFGNAQKQLKEKYKDPYYWAAFVLISN